MLEFHDKRTGRAVTVERQDADTVQLHLQRHKTTSGTLIHLTPEDAVRLAGDCWLLAAIYRGR